MTGRIILVTGGATGIGLATARRFAEAGDRVAIADIDGEAASARAMELGEIHIGVAADVASAKDVSRMVAACVDRWGRLDVLVNNAGIVDSDVASMVNLSIPKVRRLLAVNVNGPYLAAQEAAKVMIGQGKGAIINLASCAGAIAVPHQIAYCASKASVAALTRSMAREWGGKGVRVNAVAPGYTRTQLIDDLIAAGKFDTGSASSRVPLGRLGEPVEMANSVFYLSSDEASFVNGVTLMTDGGLVSFGGSGPASFVESPRPPAKHGVRSVVVSGLDNEVGPMIARKFAAAGDKVTLFDNDRPRVERLGRELEAPAYFGDVGDEAAAQAMANAASKLFGGIDVLINNVPCADHTRDGRFGVAEFDSEIQRRLIGLLVVAKAVGNHMLQRPEGAIVNLVDVGHLESWPGHGDGVVRSAVTMVTRGLACEWASAGIRVNAVFSALIDQGRRHECPSASGLPMGRFGRTDEVADGVTFLASAAASYVTGSVLEVDGGWAAQSGGRMAQERS